MTTSNNNKAESSKVMDESNNTQFPWKLHVLLDEAESKHFSSIVCWLPNGNGLKVHSKKDFAEQVMPKYFQSNKYKSFQRNLNLWGFQTLTKDPEKGAIFHPYFIRGNADRCHLMKRIKVKKNSKPQTVDLGELRAQVAKETMGSTSIPSPSSPAPPLSDALTVLRAASQQDIPHELTLNQGLITALLQHQQEQNPLTSMLLSLPQQQSTLAALTTYHQSQQQISSALLLNQLLANTNAENATSNLLASRQPLQLPSHQRVIDLERLLGLGISTAEFERSSSQH